jgi:hypothetical protein
MIAVAAAKGTIKAGPKATGKAEFRPGPLSYGTASQPIGGLPGIPRFD